MAEPDVNWHRTTGQVVQVLRGRWVYGVISMLSEGPKTPREMHDELSDTHRRLRWLFGDRPMAAGALFKPLRAMVQEGLLEHTGERSAYPQIAHYQLTPISECLLSGLDELVPWCDAHYHYLERMTRIRYGVDPDSPKPDAGILDEKDEILLLRRGVGMALGLFSPRWSWGLLSVISEEPRNIELVFEINAARIDSAQTTGQQTMPEKNGYETLRWLHRCDLICTRDAKDPPGGAVYELTELGSTLMRAFQPIGQVMNPFSTDLVAILRERRGLDVDNLPWPSTLLGADD